MNQILCTKDNYKNLNHNKRSNKNYFNVTFIISIIITIMLLSISLKLYAAENTEQIQLINTNIANNSKNIVENSTPISVIINNSETIESETIENVQTEQNESNNNTIKNNETKVNIDTKDNNNTSTQKSTTNKSTTKYKGYDVIATLNIPSLKIEYPVLSKTSDKLLNISLNKYWGANPNEVGNMVVVGHNFNDGKFFSALPKIKKGSIVKITDNTGKTLEYTVYKTDVISPYDNSCTSQLTDGHTEITLITCYNHGTQRFIAKARAN